MSVSLFIGSWGLAAMLLNQTKDICTYFVGKEKEIKCEHSESCKYASGFTCDQPLLAPVLSRFCCLSLSFWTKIGSSAMLSMKKTFLSARPAPGGCTMNFWAFGAALFPATERDLSLFWGYTYPSLICISIASASFIAVACAFLNIDQSSAFQGPCPIFCQLAIVTWISK